MYFNFAPLDIRKDIAQLSLIHCTILKKGPPHFKEFFIRAGTSTQPQRHGYHLVDPRSMHKGQLVRRSALGLVAVYNLLPAKVVEASSVSTFQGNLQKMVLDCAKSGCEEWSSLLSPLVALATHPLAWRIVLFWVACVRAWAASSPIKKRVFFLRSINRSQNNQYFLTRIGFTRKGDNHGRTYCFRSNAVFRRFL